MDATIGSILDGKVKSITTFGAFISLEGGKSGLVHISEVSSAYVNNVRDHLTEGQAVRVKVIGIEPNGKIRLSIRQAQEPRRPQQERPKQAPRVQEPTELSFEQKLKQFMSDSDSRIAGCRQYEHKTKSRKR